MPKVNEEYFEEKRNQILDAAFAVCNRKPAYDVTMSDIVAETGLSQGGVYKYFGNIDSVLAALIDRANTQGNYFGVIDKVMNSGLSPEDKLKELFTISKQYFSDMLISYNKILFELSTFFAYSSEKCHRIYQKVSTSSAFEYLMKCAAQIILNETKSGYFSPVIPAEDVFSFITASFDGIIRDVTITKCYAGKGAPQTTLCFDEEKLIRCLYLSTMTLLGKPQT
ncbi:MAG: TetR/AcrR family transcriptional regulator [Lachnospiraceae bacterium]|nr:TetR/AcrR family transcriptional regulator [Lachnospiraceae bacterium]